MTGQAFTRLQGVSIDQYKGAPGLLQTPSRSEYLGVHVAQGFERTSTGRVLEETDIMHAERREGTADEDYRLNEQLMLAQGVTPEAFGMTHSHAMSKESWEASPYYRKGMEYRPDMTETRARIMAENYDQRRYREQLVAAGDASYGLLTRGLGFGAMLIGSLPDPVNFVSFAGGAAKARAAIQVTARAGAGAAAKAGALAGMKAGAIEGAVGNAVADAVVLPDLAARGEDVGFADLMLDTVFGAILGAGLGSAGGALSGYVGAKRLARLDEITRLMTEGESRVPDDFTLPRNDDADVARAGMTGRDKRDAARAVEMALDDLSAGRPVDVGPVLRESQALGRAYDTVRDNPLGGPPDEVLATLEPEDMEKVLVHRGPAMERDGEIVVQGRALLRETGSRRGYGLVKIIFGHGEKGNRRPDMPPVTREDVLALPRMVRDWLPAELTEGQNNFLIWRIPRDDGHRLVIVSRQGLDGPDSRLVSMYVGDADKPASARKKQNLPESSVSRVFRGEDTGQGITISHLTVGEKYGGNPLVSLAGENPQQPIGRIGGGKSPNYQDTAGGGFTHSSRRRRDEDSIRSGRPHVNVSLQGLDGPDSRLVSMYVGDADKPASKRKARSDSSTTYPGGNRDTGQRLTTSPSGGQSGLSENSISSGRPNVNFAVEQREHYPAAPDMAAHDEQAARDTADAATLQQLDEMTAAGRMDEESARALAESRDMAARAEQYDELGQSVIECIWNVGG